MARRLEFMALKDIEGGKDPGRKRKYIGTTNKNSAGRIMFNGTVNLDSEALSEPYTWTKPARVFVNSMSDLFHKDVPEQFIWDVFEVMRKTPQHTYQVLTKRPDRAAAVLNQYRASIPFAAFYPNVWIGTSVEDQQRADERIPHLLQVPARVRFLSCEPLLGPVDLDQYLGCGDSLCSCGDRGVQWVIVGGESGHGARPMHPDWARSLRDQCHAAGVAFHFKQWGEFRYNEAHGHVCERLGKKVAGRMLDGRTWDEFPG